MIAWDILNSLARLLLAGILIYKLTRFPHLFNVLERWGQAIGAGTSVLTITVIWEGQRSPFDGWATALFSIAMLLYFAGRMSRHWRHEQNNRLQLRQDMRRQ